jgi:hypothetical protein
VVEAGGLRGDDGFTSKVVLALGTKLGSCLVFPEFGSRLHEVETADEAGRKMSEKRAWQAIAHLETEVSDLTVAASLPVNRPGQIEIVVSGKKGSTSFTARYTSNTGGA